MRLGRLTADNVATIKRLEGEMPRRALADLFSVSETTISRAMRGRRYSCEKTREYMKQYREKNRDMVRAHVRAWNANNPGYNQRPDRKEKRSEIVRKSLLKRRGLTLAEYAAIALAQGGLCAICRGKPNVLGLVVDHCHASGRRRGLLCARCNSVLGFAKDSTDILRAAVEYLVRAGK